MNRCHRRGVPFLNASSLIFLFCFSSIFSSYPSCVRGWKTYPVLSSFSFSSRPFHATLSTLASRQYRDRLRLHHHLHRHPYPYHAFLRRYDPRTCRAPFPAKVSALGRNASGLPAPVP
uniref:Putative secreted protein n=1 Tax=Anopheles darlingi TaxID=43151 RepID=A0A2M4DM39_ANODA